MGQRTLEQVWDRSRDPQVGLGRVGDPRGGPERVGIPSGWSGTGRGTFEQARAGSGDPREGLERVTGH